MRTVTIEAWNGEHYSFGNGGNVLNPTMRLRRHAGPGELRVLVWRSTLSNEDQPQDAVLAAITQARGLWRSTAAFRPSRDSELCEDVIRELADTKYVSTCSPEYQFKQAKLSFVIGVTPAMAGAVCGRYAAVHRGVGELRRRRLRLGICKRSGCPSASASASSVYERSWLRLSASALVSAFAKPSATGR